MRGRFLSIKKYMPTSTVSMYSSSEYSDAAWPLECKFSSELWWLPLTNTPFPFSFGARVGLASRDAKIRERFELFLFANKTQNHPTERWIWIWSNFFHYFRSNGFQVIDIYPIQFVNAAHKFGNIICVRHCFDNFFQFFYVQFHCSFARQFAQGSIWVPFGSKIMLKFTLENTKMNIQICIDFVTSF